MEHPVHITALLCARPVQSGYGNKLDLFVDVCGRNGRKRVGGLLTGCDRIGKTAGLSSGSGGKKGTQWEQDLLLYKRRTKNKPIKIKQTPR